VYAVDGKTLRGARQPGGQQTKLVCVVDHTHRLVLTQTEIIDGNEIAAFVTALGRGPQSVSNSAPGGKPLRSRNPASGPASSTGGC